MNDHDGCIVLNLLNALDGNSAWRENHGSHINALVEACGGVSAVFESDVSALTRVEGIDAELAGRILRWRDFVDLDRELETAKNNGVTILSRTDAEYPDSLRGLGNPPLCLYVLGSTPRGLPDKSIAIVGTRTPTDFGSRMARRFSESAVSAGWTTVSGLALGIDAAAHHATVDAGGRTVAVLGSGIARVYPVENIELARAIVRTGGTIVSEYPMETGVMSGTLPRRNRIIAGLSRCTLVVQAAGKSGALMTAKHARKLGRPVFAVPGDEDDPLSAGCIRLIRQGGRPVTDFSEILNAI